MYHQIFWDRYKWVYKDIGYSKSILPNKPNYLSKEITDILFLNKDIEIIGNIYENPELSK